MIRELFSAPFIYILGIALLPALALPYRLIGVHAADQKGIIAALLLGFSLLGMALVLLRNRQLGDITLPFVAYPALLLAGVGIVSALVNHLSLTKFFGMSFAVGTGGSLILFAASVVLGSFVSKGQGVWFMKVFMMVVLVLSFVFALLSPFSDGIRGMFPLVWPEPPFLLIAGLLAAIAFFDTQVGGMRVMYGLAAVIFASFASFVFLPVAAAVGCALLVLFSAWRIFGERSMPWASIAGALFFAALLISGFQGFIRPPADTRPSIEITQVAGAAVYFTSLRGALLGTGPDTFATTWEQYRPTELNSVPPAQEDNSIRDSISTEGYTTVLTWLLTLGFVGVAVYILCFLFLFWGAGAAAVGMRLPELSEGAFAPAALVALLGLGVSIFSVIGTASFLLTGASLGLAAGLAMPSAPVLARSRLKNSLVGIVLLLAGGALLLLSSAQFAAASLYTRGHNAFVAGEYQRAVNASTRAAALWPASVYLQDAAAASIRVLKLHGADYAPGSAEALAIDHARALARASIEQDPQDYRSWLWAGMLEEIVADGSASSSAQNSAEEFFAQARLLAPTRSDIVLKQASLSLARNDVDRARQYIADALALEPTNTQAQRLLSVTTGTLFVATSSEPN